MTGLDNSAVTGLSTRAAERLWHDSINDPQSTKDQVKANDLEGNDIGYVALAKRLLTLTVDCVSSQ